MNSKRSAMDRTAADKNYVAEATRRRRRILRAGFFFIHRKLRPMNQKRSAMDAHSALRENGCLCNCASAREFILANSFNHDYIRKGEVWQILSWRERWFWLQGQQFMDLFRGGSRAVHAAAVLLQVPVMAVQERRSAARSPEKRRMQEKWKIRSRKKKRFSLESCIV